MAFLSLSTVLVVLVSMDTKSFAMHIDVEFGNFEALTCYTCPDKHNNKQCNKWAPDIPCPFRHTVCKTVHRFNNSTGQSLHVDKMCAMPEHCTSDDVGCKATDIEGEIECVSCCTVSYCNVAVPYNVTTSQTLSISQTGSTGSHVSIIDRLMLVATFSLTVLANI
ncbi:ly6/PLAUR domain-containing protein 6-like [Ruditapes philippinarum]|uniref:ly6/PLAUR domain-containing protein 6-like n=1 Tax=Ruditapes philippinarum TaxID=129788 RepID=UPI00295AA4E2|nr:ly6/PLAUR domain-containing protein 6-like [Ruditapes philippinarum]